MLNSVFSIPIFAQEEETTEETTTEEDTVTEEETTTDEETVPGEETITDEETTTEESTTISTDETSDTQDTTEGTDLVIDSTTDNSLGFLDSIDSMWLWVILGVGGVVLVGSLIGIISLVKKEKNEGDSESTPIVPQPVKEPEVIQETPAPMDLPTQPTQETPTQIPTSPMVENIQEEVSESIEKPAPQEIPSIKETLGDASSYQEPNANGRVVSNTVPQTDVNQDLADLNIMGTPQTVEPQISTIETITVKPEAIVQENPVINPNTELNNGRAMNLEVNQLPQQEKPTPDTSQSQINNEAMNLMNSTPIPQASTTSSSVTESTVNPVVESQIPAQNAPPSEPIMTTPPTNNSTPIPQSQEQTLASENLSNQDLTQPIDTTSL